MGLKELMLKDGWWPARGQRGCIFTPTVEPGPPNDDAEEFSQGSLPREHSTNLSTHLSRARSPLTVHPCGHNEEILEDMLNRYQDCFGAMKSTT
jgi:hypothetical protein